MKRSLLMAAFGFLAMHVVNPASAQTPQNKKRSMVFEFSETWCGPCGAYGVPLADTTDHRLAGGDKGYLISIKTSSSPTMMNGAGGSMLLDNYDIQGVPTFIVNHTDYGDINSIMGAISIFNATPVTASAAANMSITGNTLTVSAKAKFWTAATGEYYMTAIVTEDKIVAAQNGASPNTVHPHLLRGAMRTSGTSLAITPWGEQIGTTSIAANTEFSKSYSLTIDAGWQKANLEVYIVLFKKNGTKYEYVNAEKAKTGSTGINTAAVSLLEQARLYPNPTGSTANLDLAVMQPTQISLCVVDALGRSVFTASHSLSAGQHTLTLPSNKWANGVYDVQIIADQQGRTSKKLVIRK